MSFSVLPLGVGDAFSQKYYSPCLLLEAEGVKVLVDCPHPIRRMMFEAGQRAGMSLDVADITSVLLTHLHSDHCSGLEAFAFFSYFALQRKTHLVAHPTVMKELWPHRLQSGMRQLLRQRRTQEGTFSWEKVSYQFEDFFDHQALSTEESVQVGPFSVECRWTIHHIPTTALRVRVGDLCLGYSADTAFDPTLIEWLADADLILHETNLGAHTPYERLAALPETYKRKMRLIHYTDDFPCETSEIRVLEEGVWCSVGGES